MDVKLIGIADIEVELCIKQFVLRIYKCTAQLEVGMQVLSFLG